MRGFAAGLLVGVLLIVGGIYFYFVSGMAPAAVVDAPLPYEKKMAGTSLRAHIEKANVPPSPVPADEPNFVAAAKVYKERCAVCHGLPDQRPPEIAESMYPHAPMLFKGKGVTDDPAGESYWKISNGIRLTGMPAFKTILTDVQVWQLAQLVAHADKIPDSAKGILVPDPPVVVPVPENPVKLGVFPSK